MGCKEVRWRMTFALLAGTAPVRMDRQRPATTSWHRCAQKGKVQSRIRLSRSGSMTGVTLPEMARVYGSPRMEGRGAGGGMCMAANWSVSTFSQMFSPVGSGCLSLSMSCVMAVRIITVPFPALQVRSWPSPVVPALRALSKIPIGPWPTMTYLNAEISMTNPRLTHVTFHHCMYGSTRHKNTRLVQPPSLSRA